MPPMQQRISPYVFGISAIAAMGGFLFGYDTAVISGAIGPIKQEMSLTELQEGWAVGCILVGCMLGAIGAGILSDLFGRKKVLLGTSLFFAASAILSALPHTLNGLVVARLIGGLAVGVSSVVAPLYIAEVSPAAVRGRLVTLNQMAIVLGILCSYFVNALLVDSGDNNWRYMLAAESVPAFLLLLGLLFVPESPRWLVTHGRDDEALNILDRVGGEAHARTELAAIHQVIAEEEPDLRELLRPGVFRAVIIGVVLALLGQISGINAIIYYGPRIFEKAQFVQNAAFWSQVLIGLVNTIATIFAILWIDKLGRKALLLIGAGGMCVCLVLTGLMLPSEAVGPVWKLIPIASYVAFFAVGLGGTVWVLLSEIYPTRIRGRAMGIATLSVWASNFVLTQTFPWLLENLGERYTFWFFAGVCVVMLFFVQMYISETKGKSLEQIEHEYHAARSNEMA